MGPRVHGTVARDLTPSAVQEALASMQPSTLKRKERVGPFGGDSQRSVGQVWWRADNRRWSL